MPWQSSDNCASPWQPENGAIARSIGPQESVSSKFDRRDREASTPVSRRIRIVGSARCRVFVAPLHNFCGFAFSVFIAGAVAALIAQPQVPITFADVTRQAGVTFT